MRICNNNNMHNPKRDVGRCYACCMPSTPIYTAFIPCFAVYILPSSPVLLQLYCTCFSTFWHSHPYILEHFNGLLLLCFTGFRCILACKYNACASPTPFCCSWSCEMHVGNNEEMAFNYTEVLYSTS